MVAALLPASLPATVGAQSAPDWDVAGGHFYTQTGGGSGKGYAVTDADGVGFWAAFQQVGGVEVVGYPVSQRFTHGGFVTQAMQKAVFQWRPESKSVAFVNVFDDLATAGKDQFLLEVRQTPRAQPFPAEAGKPFDEVVKIRQAALDARPAMKEIYFAARDPILQYGLPTSQVTDMGNHYAIRLQRAVIQEWKQDVPWARAGQATVANGGDIGKEAGLWPQPSLAAADAGAAPPVAAAPAAPAPAAPAAPAAAPVASAGALPSPTGGVKLGPNQAPPYDTPIAWDTQPGRLNIVQVVRTRLGGDRIVGLLRNDSAGPVTNVKLLITGSDARGNTSPRLQTIGSIYRNAIAPGQVVPFEAQGSLPDAATVNVSVSSTPGAGLAAFRDLQPQITGQTRNSRGWLVVQGTVQNSTGGARRNLQVVVAGLDAQGNLQDVGSGTTSPPDLEPGQTGTFAITLPSNTSKVTDLRASVEAYERSLEINTDVGGNTDHGGATQP
jgi:hypothetical protein